MVKLVQQGGPRRVGIAGDGQGPDIMCSEHRLEAAIEVLVGQQPVEKKRNLRDVHLMADGRDGTMQIGERRNVVEPGDLGHETVE